MIASEKSISAPPRRASQRLVVAAPVLLISAGLTVRLIGAYSRFLNADEAMHYLLALQPTVADAYRASQGTAHPPLLIIFLHYWRMISHSEFFLRMPSVIAGTAVACAFLVALFAAAPSPAASPDGWTFVQVQRTNSLTLQFATDSYATQNAFGGAFVGSAVQSSLQSSIALRSSSGRVMANGTAPKGDFTVGTRTTSDFSGTAKQSA